MTAKLRDWVILVTFETDPANTTGFSPIPARDLLPHCVAGPSYWPSRNGLDGSLVMTIETATLNEALMEAAKAVDMTLQAQVIKHLVKARRLYADTWELGLSRHRHGRWFGVIVFRYFAEDYTTRSYYVGHGNWPDGWQPDYPKAVTP